LCVKVSYELLAASYEFSMLAANSSWLVADDYHVDC